MSEEKKRENVWNYPRPPALERTSLRLRVVWKPQNGEPMTVADTTEGYRVLETSHPPTYYIPSKDVKMDWLKLSARSSFCEWKGQATYYHFVGPSSSTQIKDRIWTYQSPTPRFVPIKDYLSFYASAGRSSDGDWECFVDDEKVVPQDGDFYGGWKTSWIEGKMKGGAGTWGW